MSDPSPNEPPGSAWSTPAQSGVAFHAGTDHEAPASPRMARLVGWVFLAVGLLLLGLGAYLLVDARNFVARAETAEGVVVSLSRNREGGTAPVFRFVTRDGRSVEAPHSVFSSPPAWTVNERATLRYDPARPERAAPATIVSTYLAPMIVLPMGLVFAVVGGAVLAWTRRPRAG